MDLGLFAILGQVATYPSLAIIIILVMLLAPDFYSTIILPISRLLFT